MYVCIRHSESDNIEQTSLGYNTVKWKYAKISGVVNETHIVIAFGKVPITCMLYVPHLTRI